VDVTGDLPVYKSHAFEEGIKEWMNLEISRRENMFK
jgi:hypothetical protein